MVWLLISVAVGGAIVGLAVGTIGLFVVGSDAPQSAPMPGTSQDIGADRPILLVDDPTPARPEHSHAA